MAKTWSSSDASANQPISFGQAPVTSYGSRSMSSSLAAPASQRSSNWRRKPSPSWSRPPEEISLPQDSSTASQGRVAISQVYSLLAMTSSPSASSFSRRLYRNLSKVAFLQEDVTLSAVPELRAG